MDDVEQDSLRRIAHLLCLRSKSNTFTSSLSPLLSSPLLSSPILTITLPCPRAAFLTMASQYVTEPPPSGLVSLSTTKGPILIELFAQQTPLASRNFLTLALEGFYDNITFHRFIPNFILQSGDPSATGSGGESIYGSPFPIEPHSRLKFNRRGLLGMAAENKQNESQFFLTLDATPELQGKHTMFGRVVGKSIYTLMELVEGVEVVDGDRPRYELKLLAVEVLECPFDDLKPRVTKEERKMQEKKAREDKERSKVEEDKRKRGGAGKKNTKLLSFGGEEEEAEGEEVVRLKGPKSSHDLLSDGKLSKQAMEVAGKEGKRAKRDGQTASLQGAKVAANESKANAAPSHTNQPVQAATSSSTNLKSAPQQSRPSSSSSKPPLISTSSTSSSAKTYLTAQRAKYTSSKPPANDSYTALLSFQSRLRTSSTPTSHRTSFPTPTPLEDDDEAKEYGSSDDDSDWRSHRLDAGGKPLVAVKESMDDYEVLDPREHRSNHREERTGKRGRDWVEHSRQYPDRYDSHREDKSRHRRDRQRR